MASSRGSSTRSSSRPRRSSAKQTALIFSRRNYVLLIAGVVAIVVGYALMRIENEVDGIISLYLAPLLILAGYLEVIFAILWREKTPESASTEANS